MEILSPAGSPQALYAAVASGADAVYFGGGGFNARHFAQNFEGEDMARAVSFCRQNGVRSYVTVNTLVSDLELPAVTAYLLSLIHILPAYSVRDESGWPTVSASSSPFSKAARARLAFS